jgi:hypothetical protein
MEPPMHRLQTRVLPAVNRPLLVVPRILGELNHLLSKANKIAWVVCPGFIPAVADVHVPLGPSTNVRGVVEIELPTFIVSYDERPEAIARAWVDCDAVRTLVHVPGVASVLLEQEDLERVFRVRADDTDGAYGGSEVAGLGDVDDAGRVDVVGVVLGVAFQGFDHDLGHDSMALVFRVEGATLQQR